MYKSDYGLKSTVKIAMLKNTDCITTYRTFKKKKKKKKKIDHRNTCQKIAVNSGHIKNYRQYFHLESY